MIISLLISGMHLFNWNVFVIIFVPVHSNRNVLTSEAKILKVCHNVDNGSVAVQMKSGEVFRYTAGKLVLCLKCIQNEISYFMKKKYMKNLNERH